MALALHDAEHGYYALGPERLGPAGDFFTASDLGPLFGSCLARQLVEMDRRLGSPARFRYAEFGAGRGALARDVLDAALDLDAGFARRLDVVLVDASPGMRAAAAARVQEARVLAPPGPDDAEPGCAAAVELFDALPVHRVRRRAGQLVEVYVDVGPDGRLREVEGEPAADAAAWAERYGAAPRDGDEAEAAPALHAAFDEVQRSLARGFVIVVDYGDPSAALYAPTRSRGTLLAYHRHHVSEDLLDRVGDQDLTAHVNLTALDDAARACGLRPLGVTTQDRFLIANGLLEVFESSEVETWRDPARVRARLQAMQLIHPHGMGRAFKVAIYAKAVDSQMPLSGLRDPFAGA